MKGIPAVSLLKKLLLSQSSRRRLWTSLFALSLGLFLLLAAVLLWWNFDFLLSGKASGQHLDGSYLTLSRRVTNENMGQPGETVFSPAAMESLRQAPQVEDLGEVISLRPQAYMRLQLGPGLGFSTVLVLESVPNRFIDHCPPDWNWSPGSRRVPVILSSSFLSLYNYAFAPSQGLPQLSEESIKSLPFSLAIGQGSRSESFVAQVVGFSDRINSVLVPAPFIQEMNIQSGEETQSVSRIVVKVKDPSNKGFTDFLKEHDYVTNSELGRWSQLSAVVHSIVFFVGILAVLLVLVSVLVFVQFIELNIAKAKSSVVLLQELGCSPSSLRRYLQQHFFQLLLLAIVSAVCMGMIVQLLCSFLGSKSGLHFRLIPGWPFWVSVLFVGCGLFAQLRRSITTAIKF
ncbi:MAG: hypothetical protein JST06_02915 [Bacteroidetes bacterium]|nr:hypothetical protein [Bacteroidota bacterium]MBS1630255.1 hypothetical protein [Bacteroidota bacterium]